MKQKLGTKVYNSTVLGHTEEPKKKTRAEFKRENKNRPREMSSKRQVPLIQRKKKSYKPSETAPRDPRFDSNCGDFDRNEFKERFSFVNELKEKEAAELKEKLRSTASADEKSKIKLLIQRLNNQAREEQKRVMRNKADDDKRTQIKQARQEGKTPIFVSKKKQKIQELVDQFKELKETGKLQKHLEKRRKKNLARDRKRIHLEDE